MTGQTGIDNRHTASGARACRASISIAVDQVGGHDVVADAVQLRTKPHGRALSEVAMALSRPYVGRPVMVGVSVARCCAARGVARPGRRSWCAGGDVDLRTGPELQPSWGDRAGTVGACVRGVRRGGGDRRPERSRSAVGGPRGRCSQRRPTPRPARRTWPRSPKPPGPRSSPRTRRPASGRCRRRRRRCRSRRSRTSPGTGSGWASCRRTATSRSPTCCGPGRTG